jgi:hypothetical protein
MTAKITLKYSILMLFGGLICAFTVVFISNFFLSGPALGKHYDFLINFLKSPAVAREIFIIETEEMTDGNDLFTVLMTLTEMGASSFVMTGKLSPASSPIMLTEAQIRRRFNDEYVIVGSNIRNLFEGIRLGSVSPLQAPVFVDRLVELTELGRDRLLSALIDRDEDLIRSVAVFGNYMEVEENPQPDRDGLIRRVKPLTYDGSFEHPVYSSLKNRYAASQIESNDLGLIFWMRRSDGAEYDIPLDKNGNVITPWNTPFRRVNISLFADYRYSEFALREALAAAAESGIFSETPPELSPLFLGDHALTLREELLHTADYENRFAWINARTNYINSLNNFFNNTAVNNNDETFILMFDEYLRFTNIRSTLESNIPLSYCIMGPQNNALYSALIANTVITGSHIKPVYDREVLFWSLFACLIVLLTVFLMRPVFVLLAGILLSVFAASVFSLIFIFVSYWIDPLIVLFSCLSGALVIFYCKCALLNNRKRSFRTAYGAVVSPNTLQGLIANGKPSPSQTCVSYAAIIAIKDINLLNKEDIEKPQDAGKLRKSFFSSVKKVIFSYGAVIAGFEGDTILACFGSPLEPVPVLTTCKWAEDGTPVKSYNPVDKACALVRDLIQNEKITWRFGIDAGDCTFYWSEETGYSVNGRAAIRARILVSKATRFKARALITDTVRDKININSEKIGTLYDENDTFFSL